MKCLKDSGSNHPLVGNQVTYKEAELDGAHRGCLLAAVAMCKQSILDLFDSTEQQWICHSCRFKPDHQAMLSSQPTCPCGISLQTTAGVYSAMWMDGLSRKYTGKVLTQTEKTDLTEVNFAQLAEDLLNPHHGQQNGLIRPDHWCQGTEGTCACTKVPNKVEASNVVDRTPMLWLSLVMGALLIIWKWPQKMT